MIDTDDFSMRLRKRSIVVDQKQILIARLSGSLQEQDLAEPVNCNGYGRIRHFKLTRHTDWSPNPLPIVPAARALGYPAQEELRAQVFQNSACNWRCWYCFVDDSRLSANLKVSQFFTPSELIDLYLQEPNYPEVIDLTGGQPDLIPEWVVWTMEALEERGLQEKVFLWSDDNLSTRYFWEYLSVKERKIMVNYPKYSRVACFKGYDPLSFAFNTMAEPDLFERQFVIYRDLLKEGIDMYAYVTFTAIPQEGFRFAVEKFVDKLQSIHPNLPLRTVPLKVEHIFRPTQKRIRNKHLRAMEFQHEVHSVWLEELSKRFSPADLRTQISDISIRL